MKDLSAKIRLLYLPFLLIAASCIILYSFLNWLIFIKGRADLTGRSDRYTHLYCVQPAHGFKRQYRQRSTYRGTDKWLYYRAFNGFFIEKTMTITPSTHP